MHLKTLLNVVIPISSNWSCSGKAHSRWRMKWLPVVSNTGAWTSYCFSRKWLTLARFQSRNVSNFLLPTEPDSTFRSGPLPLRERGSCSSVSPSDSKFPMAFSQPISTRIAKTLFASRTTSSARLLLNNVSVFTTKPVFARTFSTVITSCKIFSSFQEIIYSCIPRSGLRLYI